MVSLHEELELAKAAQSALRNLSANVGATVRQAMYVAAHAGPSDCRLNDAHHTVVEALANLIDAPEDVLFERIEEAKAAIEEWIDCLEMD